MLTCKSKFGIATIVALACSVPAFAANDKAGQNPNPKAELAPAVELQISNVNLHLDRSVVLEIRHLRGQMAPTNHTEPITLDDVNSFEVRINSAEIAVSARTMADLPNNYVFAYPGAPLKHIEITVQNGTIKQTGVMHKGVDLPFEIEGTLDVTPEGEIQLHASKIRSAHLPFKGLLHLFGEDLSKLFNLKQDRGVRLEGDNILLSPRRILPPPRIDGKVAAVRVEGDRIIQTFETKEVKPLAPPLTVRNYIYHRGGVLRFGKLTMHDADLEIVNSSKRATFDFSLPEYNRQLVAGYSKNTPVHGLIVFMPDFGAPPGSSGPPGPLSPPSTAIEQRSKAK
jgi:hypothetical protein